MSANSHEGLNLREGIEGRKKGRGLLIWAIALGQREDEKGVRGALVD